MEKLVVWGGKPLNGKVSISGSKNASLPIMVASLLCTGKTILKNIPNIKDVEITAEILSGLGLKVKKGLNRVIVESNSIVNNQIPYHLIRRIRASFVFAGALLARTGKAKIAMPGGCTIGKRPVDLHLHGLASLGARIEKKHGYFNFKANKLVGTKINLSYPSVGATENIIMAACLAKGKTVIKNAAREPEIIDLCTFLNKAGAHIKAGSNVLTIEGVKELNGVEHSVIPDRIEAGTYMVAAAMTKGQITIKNIIPDHLKSTVKKLKKAGTLIVEKEDSLEISATKIKPVNVTTAPFPGFPTDMQPMFMSLMSIASGKSIITEAIFENRFQHVPELNRMGADITINGNKAIINGRPKLSGTQLTAKDLRGNAALLLAALAAEGYTEILEPHHLYRGYEKTKKLKILGADIELL